MHPSVRWFVTSTMESAPWWVGCKDDMELYGGFPEMGLPNNDGLNGKILLKWMIWGYPYFRKPPCCNASKRLSAGQACAREHFACLVRCLGTGDSTTEGNQHQESRRANKCSCRKVVQTPPSRKSYQYTMVCPDLRASLCLSQKCHQRVSAAKNASECVG